jgi:hypothetical protein
LNFINKENNPNKIIELVENCIKDGIFNTRSYYEFNQLINKVTEKEFQKLSKKVTTIEDLEKVWEQEKDKPESERTINIEEKDGIKYIHLNGVDYDFLVHRVGSNVSVYDVLSYEGQLGNQAICTRYFSISVRTVSWSPKTHTPNIHLKDGLILQKRAAIIYTVVL